MENNEEHKDMGSLDLPQSVTKEADKPEKSSKKSPMKMIVTVIIIVVIVAVAAFLVNSYTSINLFGSSVGSSAYSKDAYYAVFLSNGQVYFGQIVSEDSAKTDLEDIYYLQVQENIQPGSVEQQQQLSLVKLGNELHGPKDHMMINKDHILFVEELKIDSRVVEAIMAYKAGDQDAPVETANPAN